ncbi:MAG: tetratricopeptide repeat protein [Erythrobacter sp.]|uniref:SPOR domain-containing protein n=1 Tax=Erythrobacter sp. TaxID=1042 RepID=UPI002620E1F5|nr:SPOR domain-containing protein [Erythrobacter sp.]MDJ0979917.1 tetratricopeptide repeat protein [Erythrobacter sp.]
MKMPIPMHPIPSYNVRRWLGLTALGAALASGLTIAASAQVMTSRPVSQPLPSQDTQRLNRALVALARTPNRVPALLEAGDAALAVGDLNASLGFFQRAREVDSQNARAALGLAKVYLRSGRPVRALSLFEAAESQGAEALEVGSDKALALDMVGAQTRAQQAYLALLEVSPRDEEARRRLAISYAISDNQASFEATLRPLIERRDFAAFRARAFSLAILGEQDRAAAITDAVMPRELAQQITPYLEFMPRLTPAQQAAAANLGVFPRAADIGRDTPQIAELLSAGDSDGSEPGRAAPAPATQQTAPDRRLEPMGRALGDGPVRVEDALTAQAAQTLTPSTGERQPQATQAPTAETPRVADAFGDIVASRSQTVTATPSEGAVDIAALDIPREPPPEPEKPVNPSRIWVQLAIGQDLKALGFDWRRLERKAPRLLGKFTPHTVRWGQTNRLLAGPVDSRQAARELINALKKRGIDAFRYTSPEGLEIELLSEP